MGTMIRKLLIANRGEIACRVIRTARAMGIRTVAVYSEPDANSLHAQLADEAVALGGDTPASSYLRTDAVLAAAKQIGADAIHPGYGFLSERADFAEACAAAGIQFVGPSAAAMRRLGAKIDAKQLAVESDVPIVPGYFAPDASDEDLRRAADEIGYPVMLKASAGGGGRGMRIVRSAEQFDDELATARDEALKGFGDGAMMVEKLIERPRHIEVQIIADRHGNVVALFERECSIQRRHQKLIEEAPSPFVMRHPEIWPRMKEASERLARAAGYENAGTVEFIVDPQTAEFYFLEVNARLQVEHPVTEAITGLDLVELQLRVASGEALPFSDFPRERLQGHAIEARIVAEDPARNFLPSVGPILAWRPPTDPTVRIDSGFRDGDEVSRFYDSLLAKAIVHAPDRAAATARLKTALADFHVLGVRTNIGWLLDLMDNESFRAGEFDTGFIDRELGIWQPGDVPAELGSILERVSEPGAVSTAIVGTDRPAWSQLDGWRNARV